MDIDEDSPQRLPTAFILLEDTFLKHLYTEALGNAGFAAYGSHDVSPTAVHSIQGSCDVLITSLTPKGVVAALALVFQFGNVLLLTHRADEHDCGIEDAPLSTCRILVRHYPSDARDILRLVREVLNPWRIRVRRPGEDHPAFTLIEQGRENPFTEPE